MQGSPARLLTVRSYKGLGRDSAWPGSADHPSRALETPHLSPHLLSHSRSSPLQGPVASVELALTVTEC